MAGLGRAALFLSLSAALTAGCDDTNGGGGDSGPPITVQCPRGVDKSFDIATALPLSGAPCDPAIEGTACGTICPLKDSDYFKIDHAGSLLKVDLSGSLEDGGTPIQLTYLLLGQDGKVMGTASAWTGGGIRHFQDFHCVPAGTYFIQVKDDGDDAKDGNNQYRLKVGSGQDKDPNEPGNNQPSGAKPPGTGYISCKGDQDWFTFSIGAGQLAEVRLKTDKLTPLALKYTIYDGKTKILEVGGLVDGTKAPINLLTIHALPKAGTYTLVVEDGQGRSDPETPYTLSVAAKQEQDPNEGTTRNDSPATATDCGSGCTKTGQIGSKGDYDYYRVDVSGVSGTNVGVIEMDVNYGGKANVQPQVALIFGDEATPCTKDSCCSVLSGTCSNDAIDCRRRSYICISKGDTYCSDEDCKPTSTCITEKACAGAVVCLPSKKCGGEQFSRFSDTGRVIASGPLLHQGPFYVRVGDFKNDQWDYGRNYTVRIAARVDPDAPNELNSEYFPNTPPTNINTYEWHKKAAKPSYNLSVGGGISISGHISYQGDWDWYEIQPPGSACGPNNECTLTVNFSASGGGCSNIQPVYILHKNNGDPWFAFPKDGQPLSGNPGCVYVNSSETYYFSVSDFEHNGWSWDCQYNVSISVAAGCNPPCVKHPVSGNCDAP